MTLAIDVDAADRLGRTESAALAAAEYGRFEQMLRTLNADDWSTPTPDCPMWTVRQMAAHVLAGCDACISYREAFRQFRGARGVLKDPAWHDPDGDHKMRAMNNAMNEFQIRARAHLSPSALVARFAETHPRAARARASKPRIFDLIRFKAPVGGTMSLGSLYRIVYTRDTWMHRADIARATGRPMELTPDHDGRIVADVVVEWATMHGSPFRLELTGPAGGTFTRGRDGDAMTLDAVEFCRITSGRARGERLLQTTVVW